jgi:uncharacterized membrane protein (DUF2068 family)
MSDGRDMVFAPGVTRGRRRKLHYELLGCGWHGHELVGRDVRTVRAQDAEVLRDGGGVRWHRCLRCDAWLALAPPEHPVRDFCPAREDIVVPLRGKPLRDRYVLRLIALDRLVHFLVLGTLAVGIVLFARHRAELSGGFFRVMDTLQGAVGGRTGTSGGLLGELAKAFHARSSTLWLVGAVVAGYALLEGVEAVGLWFAKRWAEYLTFVATTVLLIPELYELSGRISATKVLTLIINLAVVIYLLYAKRLFGLRGGGAAERRERDRDTGWTAVQSVFTGQTPA